MKTWGLWALGLVLACDRSGAVAEPEAKPTEAEVVPAEAPKPAPEPPDPKTRAPVLAREVLILDGHIDVPWRLHKAKDDPTLNIDVSGPAEDGNFDYPRAKAGGLDAPFMSIYVSPDFEMKGADKVAEALISMVETIAHEHPQKFALAPTVAAVRSNFAAGRISLPMGMENGAPLMGKLANVAHFHERGIRYITLAHSKDNHISDSSYDTRHTHKGLSKFGRKVVPEMNRVGIMVDVSHISDDAFWQVIELSRAPVIASHSSCRHFTPGFERNMSDKMIEALAKAGGVIQVNFGSGFLSKELRDGRKAHDANLKAHLEQLSVSPESAKGEAASAAYEEAHPAPRADVALVADHIEHVIALVGVEHVGLGSDFDGVGDSLPSGLRSVADYPNLIEELLRRGHDEAAIAKIAGENVLRVWTEVERFAAASGD